MLDVLMLTRFDHANTGYRFSKCLELLGLEVLFYKGKRHPYNYPQQGKIHKAITKSKNVKKSAKSKLYVPSLRPLVEEAKVIHFVASTLVDTDADLSKKKVVVQHGGSSYRQNHKKLNWLFNSIADATVVQMPDLMGLGAKNETYISFPVDTNHIHPNFGRKDSKFLVGHFPSGAGTKGTKTILEAVRELEATPAFGKRFKYIGVTDLTDRPKDSLSWEKNLDRMKDCDIVIDGCNLSQRDKVFGEWGNSAFEAAALGTIPITHSLKVRLYEKNYGKCPMHIANSKEDIISRLKNILLMGDEELLKEKKKMRHWIEEKHSFEATARRLWNKIYCKFFDREVNL